MKLLEKRRHSANLECTAVAHLQAQQQQQQFCQWFVVGTTALILLLIAVASYRSLTQQIAGSNAAIHSSLAQSKLENILFLIADVETGYHGYVITGQESYLVPYNRAYKLIQNVKVQNLKTTHPLHQQSFDRLELLIAEKLAISQQIIDLCRQNYFTAAQSLLLVAKGKNLIDQIRLSISQISQLDRQLVEEQTILAAKSAEQMIFGFNCGLLLTFFFLAAIYYCLCFENFQKRQIQSLKKWEAVEVLKECQNQVKPIALLPEKLYQFFAFPGIKFASYIHSILGDLLNSYSSKVKSNTIQINIDKNVYLNIENALFCGLIVNELVFNSFKYAFTNCTTGEIRIDFYLNTNYGVLMVNDNGRGLPKDFDFDKDQTLGLKLVRS